MPGIIEEDQWETVCLIERLIGRVFICLRYFVYLFSYPEARVCLINIWLKNDSPV